MLMNNLDPEVAEDPANLVVYGGTGRAARSWEAFHAIVATLRRLDERRDAARAERQAGRRVPHPRAGAARADREQPARARLGRLGDVPAARGRGPDDVRPDDRRLVDLHRHAGDRAGHVRDVRGGRAQALRRHAARPPRADRRLRRDGRRAAARGRRCSTASAWSSTSTRTASSAASRRATSTSWRPTSTPPCARSRRRARPGEGRSIGLVGAAGEVFRAAARARRRARRRHRPDERPRSARRLRPGRALARRGRRAARVRPAALHRALARLDGRATAPRWSSSRSAARRSSTTATTCAPRPARAASTQAFDYPGFVPAYVRPLFCTGIGPFRWAALSGDPDDIAATDAALGELFPENEHLQRWLELARTRIAFQGLPARICWLGYGERAPRRPALQRARALGRGHRADRDRPRPPRLGLGRLALPRDRGDAGRLGRDRRLADPERAARTSPRARPGSPSTTAAASASAARSTPGAQVVADGTRRRRAARRARAHERSRHRRDAPRRRGLRRSRSRRRASAASTCPCCRDRVAARPRPRARARTARARGRCRRAARTGGSSAIVDAAGRGRARRRRAPARPAARPGPRQRALARLPARTCAAASRCATRPRRRTTSGRGARRCTRPPRRSTRAACARSAEECFDAGRRGGLHDGRRVPLRPPPAGRHARTRSRTSSRWRSSRRRARSASASCCCWPRTRARARVAGRRRSSGASATAASRPTWTASSACAAAVAGDPLVTVGYAPHSLRAVPREWLVAIARARARARAIRCTSTPASSRARSRSRVEEFGLRPDRAPRRLRPARRPRRPSCTPRTCSPRELDLLGRDARRRCAPARRPRPTSATASCRPAELWERGVRSRRRRLERAPRSVRGGPRDGGLRAPPERRRNVLVADGDAGPAPSLWRCLTVHGAHSLGLAAPGSRQQARPPTWSRSTSQHPEIRGVAPEHLPPRSCSAARPRWCARPGSPARARRHLGR